MNESPETPEILPRVLYRDALMLALDKPAGIAVHKVRGGGAEFESEFEQLTYGPLREPSLASKRNTRALPATSP